MSKSSLFSHPNHQPCPQCGAPLLVRHGKHGAFLGCSHYPRCDYQQALKSQPAGHTVKLLEGQFCPLCQHSLALRQGRFGMFIACCHYPDCPHSETLNKPDHTAIHCPQCASGHLLMRHSRFGKPFYACNRYPACQFAIKLTPVAGICEFCQYPLLVEKNTARGVKHYCASKQCGKPVSE